MTFAEHCFGVRHRWSSAVLAGALAGTGALCLPSPALAQGFVSSATAGNGASSTTSAKAGKTKHEELRSMEANVHDGILTVDGLVAKVDLNYKVDAPFLYFFVPGVGTVIVADGKFPHAVEEKKAFNHSTLTVTADGHQVQLSNGGQILKDREHDAWVAVDPTQAGVERMPKMGYGTALAAPYQWPGAKPEVMPTTTAGAPPIPANLQPKMETTSSYSVTVMPAAAQ